MQLHSLTKTLVLVLLLVFLSTTATLKMDGGSNLRQEIWVFENLKLGTDLQMAQSQYSDQVFLFGDVTFDMVTSFCYYNKELYLYRGINMQGTTWEIIEDEKETEGGNPSLQSNLFFIKATGSLNIVDLNLNNGEVTTYTFTDIPLFEGAKLARVQDRFLISNSLVNSPKLCLSSIYLDKREKLMCRHIKNYEFREIIPMFEDQAALVFFNQNQPPVASTKLIAKYALEEESSFAFTLSDNSISTFISSSTSFYSNQTGLFYSVDLDKRKMILTILEPSVWSFHFVSQGTFFASRDIKVNSILGINREGNTLYFDANYFERGVGDAIFFMLDLKSGIINGYRMSSTTVFFQIQGSQLISMRTQRLLITPDTIYFSKSPVDSFTAVDDVKLQVLEVLNPEEVYSMGSSMLHLDDLEVFSSNVSGSPQKEMKTPTVERLPSIPVYFQEYPIIRTVLNSAQLWLDANFSETVGKGVTNSSRILGFNSGGTFEIRGYSVAFQKDKALIKGLPVTEENQTIHLALETTFELHNEYSQLGDNVDSVITERPVHIFFFQCIFGCLNCESIYSCRECKQGYTAVNNKLCVRDSTKSIFNFSFSALVIILLILLIALCYKQKLELDPSKKRLEKEKYGNYYMSLIRLSEKVSIVFLIYFSLITLVEEPWINRVVHSLPLFLMPYLAPPLPFFLLLTNLNFYDYLQLAQWYSVAICVVLLLFNIHTLLFRRNSFDRNRSLRTFSVILKHNTFPITVCSSYSLYRVWTGQNVLTDIFVLASYVITSPVMISCWLASFYDWADQIFYATEPKHTVQKTLFYEMKVAPSALLYEVLFQALSFINCVVAFFILVLLSEEQSAEYPVLCLTITFCAIEGVWFLYLVIVCPFRNKNMNVVKIITQGLVCAMAGLATSAIFEAQNGEFPITENYKYLVAMVSCLLAAVLSYGYPVYKTIVIWLFSNGYKIARPWILGCKQCLRASRRRRYANMDGNLSHSLNARVAQESSENSMKRRDMHLSRTQESSNDMFN